MCGGGCRPRGLARSLQVAGEFPLEKIIATPLQFNNDWSFIASGESLVTHNEMRKHRGKFLRVCAQNQYKI